MVIQVEPNWTSGNWIELNFESVSLVYFRRVRSKSDWGQAAKMAYIFSIWSLLCVNIRNQEPSEIVMFLHQKPLEKSESIILYRLNMDNQGELHCTCALFRMFTLLLFLFIFLLFKKKKCEANKNQVNKRVSNVTPEIQIHANREPLKPAHLLSVFRWHRTKKTTCSVHTDDCTGNFSFYRTFALCLPRTRIRVRLCTKQFMYVFGRSVGRSQAHLAE